MSLGSSRGWRYRFSCLGATLLLGALALTSSARAQAPALPYDQADITAALGNRVVLEALSAIARRRRDERDGTTWDPSQPLLDGR